MREILQALTFVFAAIFVCALLYSQYALFRVEIDRRKKLGWGWVGFRSPWNAKDLTEQGVVYQKRSLRALGVSLGAFALVGVLVAVSEWAAV